MRLPNGKREETRKGMRIGKAGALAAMLLWLAGCGGDQASAGANQGGSQLLAQAAVRQAAPVARQQARPQDSRTFTIDPAILPFGPLAGAQAETDRWWGVLGGAGYRIEVPKNWNGRLVMWARGYDGAGQTLDISDPPLRRHLIEGGYAWAASSFSKNNYDVRAGIEDTNALALAFTQIAAQNGRPLSAPTRIYIAGGSMGGHVAAAAVERETLATAINKVRYDAALPLCGAVADTALFDYINAYQFAAMYLAGMPATSFPVTNFQAIRGQVVDALWRIYPALPTERGEKLQNAVMNLTGGQRPLFDLSFRLKPLQDPLWDRFGNDGTIEGILPANGTDTTGIVYQLDSDPALSPEETTMNASILRIAADPNANPPQADGLRWVPKVNGEFSVPVVTLHTLGDLYVPFGMEQIYRKRAIANGSDQWLVQRAIRSPGHCDITVAEQEAAFDALIAWEQNGTKPVGDDVLTPSTVANSRYGCAFTDNRQGDDDPSELGLVRKLVPSC